MTSADEQIETQYFTPAQRRLLTVVVWILFLLGMLAWFVQGANRPLDPGFAPAVAMLKLCGLSLYG